VRERHDAKEAVMKYYLLSVVQPGYDELPAPEVMAEIGKRLDVFHQELREAGAWVFAGGLHGPESATVLRPQDGGDVLVTDGPYVEGKEMLGGICLVKAPDLDAALEWGRKAARATTLPIEVRLASLEREGPIEGLRPARRGHAPACDTSRCRGGRGHRTGHSPHPLVRALRSSMPEPRPSSRAE
jgi:hypothetical protein